MAAAAVAVLLLTGCTANAAPAKPVAATPAPCVADPAAVVKAGPSAASADPLPAELSARLDAAVTAALPNAATPGALVGVRTPKGTWVKAYGIADPTTGRLMADHQYQRVGSITKTFTGTLILQLASEGRLSLSDPISRYVDGMPNGDIVTVRQLLDMQSGLASYTLDTTWQNTFFSDPHRVWQPDELVATAKSLKPLFAPGARYNYSNTNTVLLGKIVERITGHPVAEEFAGRIVAPLGLTKTSFPGESAAFPSPHARGYTLQSPDATPEHSVDATDWNPSWGWTAGEMISSTRDLLAYGRALGTGQGLLPAKAQIERLSSFPGGRNTYSYGLALGCVGGWVGHTGELPGYNTTLYYQTDTDTTVTVLTNADIASGDCTQSTTLKNNPTGIPCSLPAGRLFQAVAVALGHPFAAPAQQ